MFLLFDLAGDCGIVFRQKVLGEEELFSAASAWNVVIVSGMEEPGGLMRLPFFRLVLVVLVDC